ncbi:plant intracellular Ras-group-related LRR protein 6-like [Argentina anserina]|uniref:plant intracellular Ras-group-related LRR protein 6-like n=1 Tax=Argentina anserina TaxID=57926 RepID=UPI00217624A4|nr:plant intracellular Ras-group-related LRR protein 6-like [Potentilla anserina]
MDRVIKAARASSSLNLSNSSLRLVPDEVYKSDNAVGEDEKWWEAVELQKLILAHNEIEVLKDELRNLHMLIVLNVSHNNLSKLPAAIGELAMLKSLDVSFNLLGELPEEIGSTTTLVKIDCSNNQLMDLPSSLGRCSDLSDFKNKISAIPVSIAGCSSLAEVHMGNDALSMLPSEIRALSSLGTLDLYPGSTPLHLSAIGGSLDCIRGLLAWGADRSQRDASGRMPYIVALKHKHGACAAMLNLSSAAPCLPPLKPVLTKLLPPH